MEYPTVVVSWSVIVLSQLTKTNPTNYPTTESFVERLAVTLVGTICTLLTNSTSSYPKHDQLCIVESKSSGFMCNECYILPTDEKREEQSCFSTKFNLLIILSSVGGTSPRCSV
jgi:hypothetical protein